ncbi:MAG: fibrillarin-like rRNA/tRNA 2'-O-methyltransferase [Candidatus Woesearchaeota archaeon]|nr:fibrillarin-like rRNA/tRNA 2'-O-methyltransferase [Candidatus Woesearchaeota archaeon]
MKPTKFPGIFFEETDGRKTFYTKNLTPGKQVYGEKLVAESDIEYREWDIRRSKLAAALIKGIDQLGFKEDSKVLYLGSATGTTVSHVSDICDKGMIFAIDFAPRVMRDLMFLAERRKNIIPLLADANKPEEYYSFIPAADIIYQDVAQKNQVEIFLKNINLFLKSAGYAIIAVKSRSIDVTRSPKEIFSIVRRELENSLIVVDYRVLDPFERDHCMFVCKKKNAA